MNTAEKQREKPKKPKTIKTPKGVKMKIVLLEIALILVDREERQRHAIKNLGELKSSLDMFGLIHPITVRKDYTLVAGERRLSAAKALGWTHISARIWESLTPMECEHIELEENIRRENITWQENCDAITKINALYKARDEKWLDKDTATELGISLSHLSRVIQVDKAGKADPRVFAAGSLTTAINKISRETSRAVDNELEGILAPQPRPSPGEETVAPVEPFTIYEENFITWSNAFAGERFNFLHCDFPYGIAFGNVQHLNKDVCGTYEDSAETYWELCSCLAKNLDKLCAPSSHIMFWFSMNYYNETLRFFKENTDITLDPFPLVWHKSDNKGLIADPQRGPRRVYETAFFGSRGDRKIVSPISNHYAAPTSKKIHASEKPESVLRHFFKMFVDPSTRMLDPTCGSGSSIRAAFTLKAERALGIEMNREFSGKARTELARTLAFDKVIGEAILSPEV